MSSPSFFNFPESPRGFIPVKPLTNRTDFTVASSGTISASVTISASLVPIMIIGPAAFDGTTFELEVQVEGSTTWQRFRFPGSQTTAQFVLIANGAYRLDPAWFVGVTAVRVVMDLAQAGGARTFTLVQRQI